MNDELISVVWDELKRYINTVDRPEAAENLVSILIDNDMDTDDIKSLFAGDKDIKRALTNYLSNNEEEEEEEDDEYEDDDYYDEDE